MTTVSPIRIGTRDSKLALWQANRVKDLLEQSGHACTLVSVKSEGDLDLVTPLYAMGVQGVFTKTLDAYLLSNKIDIAVHSMKDVPTQLAQGIAQAAVLERGNTDDILVLKNAAIHTDLSEEQIIGTGSVRRKAQWLHRYPHHRTDNLRGNVQTRLQKLKDSNWYGAIFAAAGLERMHLRPDEAVVLDWMLPAPAQGAVMVVCRSEDNVLLEKCGKLNHTPTALCAKIERDFLKALMGGCSTPIGALATIVDDRVIFKGNILSPDGKDKMELEQTAPLTDADNLGTDTADVLLKQGAAAIVTKIRNAGSSN